MKKIYSLFLVMMVALLSGSSAFAQEYLLPAANTAEGDNQSSVTFDQPLLATAKWKIHAETLYFGDPADATWGSRLLQVKHEWNSATTGSKANDGELTFYMRPTVGGTDSNRGKLLFRNGPANWTSYTSSVKDPVLAIDMTNGTLFQFDIISDGAGTVLASATVNGETFSYSYNKGEISSVTGLIVGSKYVTEVEVSALDGASIFKPGNITFTDVLSGASASKTLTIEGVNLNTVGGLDYAFDGADAAAFSAVAGAVSDTKGSATITFSPTEKRAYNATLTIKGHNPGLVDPQTITLSGSVIENSDLPIQISTVNDDYWYYIQFTRRAAENKVWVSPDQEDATIAQVPLNPTDNHQLWKVIGSWDSYSLVNKETGYGIKYFKEPKTDDTEAVDVYKTQESGYDDQLGFVRFSTTNNWQLINVTSEYSPKYLNDNQGKSILGYNLNDGGNQLTFIDANTTVLSPAGHAHDFGNVKIDTIKTWKIFPSVIAAKQETITAKILGDGAFTLDRASYPVSGDSVAITFTPTVVGKVYQAILVLSNSGITQQFTLTGKGIAAVEVVNNGLPVFSPSIAPSDADTWHYITFKRSGKAVKDNGLGENITQATVAVNDETQWWKFVGDTLSAQVISKSGRALSYSTVGTTPLVNPDDETIRVNAVDAAQGSPLYFKRATGTQAGNWELEFVDYQGWDSGDDGNGCALNDDENKGEKIALYMDYDPNSDAGNSLVFTQVANLVIPPVSPVVFSDESSTVWYNIQFTRRAEVKKVVQDNGADANLTQVAQVEGALNQQWKFIGDAADFIIEGTSGRKFYYNTTTKKVVASENAAHYKFVYGDGKWQASPTDQATYLDDESGSTVCYYGVNGDSGNILQFIVAEVTGASITTNPATVLDFGTVRSIKELPLVVTGEGIQRAISYSVIGTDSTSFVVIPGNDWTATGGTLNISFIPAADKTYSATLKLTTAGATATVNLTGIGDANFNSIDNFDGVEGTVIATKYYNLNGIEVSESAVKSTIGVYIKRDLLDSGKSRVAKILYIK